MTETKFSSQRVEVDAVCKSFACSGQTPGKCLHILEKISFSVADGEIVSLFGPNGCGKTTLLNIIAGLVAADSGEVRIRREDGEQPGVGYVFQIYGDSLLPWRTALDNIAFPLEIQGINAHSRKEKALELLRRLEILIDGTAYPYQLSGGQQQLVAIARALIADPKVLVLDEPFGSLDYHTRITMEQKLQHIHAITPRAMIFVSHDIDEALLLADRFLLLGSRPATVVNSIQVPEPRPRPPEWVTSKKFIELKTEVLKKFMQTAAL